MAATEPSTQACAAEPSVDNQVGWTGALLVALVMALALIGDSLLYVVLPLYAPVFGVSLAWVGLLLSANRLVRIVGYGGIAALGHHIGPKALTLVATIFAVVSTTVYAVGSGPEILLAARIVWGLAFGALNLTTVVYAVTRTDSAGRRLGVSRALSGLGPLFALSVGSYFVAVTGPREVFTAFAALTLLTVPIAWLLPRLDLASEPPARALLPPRPSRLDLFAFALGLTVDGVFVTTLSLLLSGTVSLESAVLSSGLILALRRLMEVVLAPFGGLLGDRYGAARMTLLFGTAMAAGLVAIALGWTFIGAVMVVVAQGIVGILQPVIIAASRPPSMMTRLSALATWRDTGAAIGPLTAGILVQAIGMPIIYAGLAVLMLVTLFAALWRH